MTRKNRVNLFREDDGNRDASRILECNQITSTLLITAILVEEGNTVITTSSVYKRQ